LIEILTELYAAAAIVTDDIIMSMETSMVRGPNCDCRRDITLFIQLSPINMAMGSSGFGLGLSDSSWPRSELELAYF
jgi:hypothetical protein